MLDQGRFWDRTEPRLLPSRSKAPAKHLAQQPGRSPMARSPGNSQTRRRLAIFMQGSDTEDHGVVDVENQQEKVQNLGRAQTRKPSPSKQLTPKQVFFFPRNPPNNWELPTKERGCNPTHQKGFSAVSKLMIKLSLILKAKEAGDSQHRNLNIPFGPHFTRSSLHSRTGSRKDCPPKKGVHVRLQEVWINIFTA